MSKYDSSSGPSSRPLLTIQISKSGGVIILVALAVIAVVVGLDLRARGRVQGAPKDAGDTVAVAESKPDEPEVAPNPPPSESLSGESSTGERAPVHVMRPVPTQEDTTSTTTNAHLAYSVTLTLPPAGADVSADNSNNSNDAPQPTSPSAPDAAHNPRPKGNKTPQSKNPVDDAPRDKGPLKLKGAGAVFPYPIYEKWFTQFCAEINKQRANVNIDYNAVGSGGGIAEILKGKIDFGATDIPMSDEEMTQSKGNILHVPTVLRAVVPIYNIPGVTGEVKFTSEVLADIYLGRVTSWDDEAIVNENPGKRFPNQQIVVIHRSDGDPTTYLFTDFLSKVSDEWRTSVGTGASVEWPLGLGAEEDSGVSGLVHRLDGAIGYVNMRFAMTSRLAAGSVRNPQGKFISASLESMTEAAASIRDMPSDFRVSITNAPGEKAYPITGFSWFLVPTDQKSAPRREALTAFLGWMLDHGETMTSGLDYAPLPKNVSGEVRQRLAGLQ